MNTNYYSLITNDKWIFKRYAVFYIIDESQTTTTVILLFVNCQTFVEQFRIS